MPRYQTTFCTCRFGLRTDPSKHDEACAWRLAWFDYWNNKRADRRREVINERGESA